MARKDKLLHSTLLVTAVIILSKAVGFGRDMVTTAYFGLTNANDAYNSAYSLFYLPVLLFNSCISATLIPLYTEEREQGSLAGANRFASNSINLFAVAALVVSALMYALAGPLVNLVYNGFDPEKAALTARLTQIMLLALVFNVTSISVASLLNAAEKYIAAQLTGFPLSFCVIIASVFFSEAYGIEALAWGVFAANILQLLIMIPFMRGWFKYSAVLDVKDKRFHKLMVLALPALFSMGISELNHMIDNALASGLPEGTLSAMTSSYRLITFLQGILVVPLTTIMFSKMSKRVAARDEKGALNMMLDSLMQLSVVVLPVCIIGIVLSSDVIKFAYMRGRFTLDDVAVTAGILIFYLIGIPAFGMKDFLNRMFHAMKDTKTPFRVSVVAVASHILMSFALRPLMGANGLALATSLSGYIGCAMLIVLLRKRFGRIGFSRVLKELVKIVIATAVCAAVCIVMNRIVPDVVGTAKVFVRLAVCAGVSLIVYAAGCFALRVQPMMGLVRSLRRR
ncbi:MAG: murein biosynthesis integral membrane protein MurJ [Clostridia bacterium]|nr:murein biosynthesis integral membrane protein MurJ [Clostridia bacterium]